MKKINKKNNIKKNKLLLFTILIILLVVGLVGYLINNGTLKIPFIDAFKKIDCYTDKNSLIKLNKGKIEKILNAELLYINDYKLLIPNELIKIGYEVSIDDDVLTVVSKDGSYKFVMIQLTDNYIQIKEEEIEAFFETEEYKKWYEIDKNIDIDDEKYEISLNEYDKLKLEYYSKLGYNFKNTPDITMRSLDKVVSKYLLEGEKTGALDLKVFPGIQYTQYYDWGKRERYAIPKYENDAFFGENTSKFSAYLETFHYYDYKKVNFDISLWTYDK